MFLMFFSFSLPLTGPLVPTVGSLSILSKRPTNQSYTSITSRLCKTFSLLFSEFLLYRKPFFTRKTLFLWKTFSLSERKLRCTLLTHSNKPNLFTRVSHSLLNNKSTLLYSTLISRQFDDYVLLYLRFSSTIVYLPLRWWLLLLIPIPISTSVCASSVWVSGST